VSSSSFSPSSSSSKSPEKIEDEDEKDDEDEPKTGIFHTSSSKRRPPQQFAFGETFKMPAVRRFIPVVIGQISRFIALCSEYER
jgi:hypothetical protein